jgi:3-deoxy-7-phosphoheptulonate synthase
MRIRSRAVPQKIVSGIGRSRYRPKACRVNRSAECSQTARNRVVPREVLVPMDVGLFLWLEVLGGRSMFARIKPGQTPERVVARIEECKGLKGIPFKGTDDLIVLVTGKVDDYPELEGDLRAMPEVETTGRISSKWKLSSHSTRKRATTVDIGGILIGSGRHTVVMAGPCAVESPEQIRETARAVKVMGANILRGGAFKPRTSPFGFQGLFEEGLKLMQTVGREQDLPVITELLSEDDVDLVARYSDILQIGARNCQNFRLLERAAETHKPIMLKRGGGVELAELLQAADYVLNRGNAQLILCERGIKTFERAMRNTTDINAIAWLKRETHLPVIVDPSHATGDDELVEPVGVGCIVAGADGIMVEVHPNPEKALSDGEQSLTFSQFGALMEKLIKHAEVEARPVWGSRVLIMPREERHRIARPTAST